MNTNGWDTISIVKQEVINSALKVEWDQNDPGFHYDIDNNGSCIDGIFDCFQIVDGGDAEHLRMELPIWSGTFTFNNSVYPLNGLSVIVEMVLDLVPTSNDSNSFVLKTVFTHVAETREEVDQPGWIYPLAVKGDTDMPIDMKSVFMSFICVYLINNSEKVEQIFAEINVAGMSCPDWAVPKKCKYTYLDTGHLAILSVCTNRDTPSDNDITLDGIDLNMSSFYVMSAEMAMGHFIIPALVKIYSNASESDYRFSKQAYSNIKDLTMYGIKSGAITYYPRVFNGKNIVAVSGDTFRISYDGDCDMYAGIDMTWKGWNEFKLKVDGNQNISFYISNSSFSHDEDIPWYLKWLSPIVSLITSIIVSIISDDLADDISNIMGNIRLDDLNSVEWCGVSTSVNSAYINESMIIEYK